jgi:type II secretory pathway pseudopilin PulG
LPTAAAVNTLMQRVSLSRLGGRKSVGFTLIELVVVVCLVAIFIKVALDRLLFYQEGAEKAAMEQTVAVIRSVLQLRAAEMLLNGGGKNIELLAKANPIGWLIEPPSGYRGEFLAANVEVPRGSWYFDIRDKELVYVPNLDAHLTFVAASNKRLRFRVELDFEPAEGDDAGKHGALDGARLAVVTPYKWF